MGKQVKTFKYRFHAAIPHKARSMASRVHRGEGRRLCDWGGPFKSHPRNQKRKDTQLGVFFSFVTQSYRLHAQGLFPLSLRLN